MRSHRDHGQDDLVRETTEFCPRGQNSESTC
jgi:hypothetical protein